MSPLLYATFPLDDKIAKEDVVHHISTTRPLAKKAYTCSTCGRPIAKGEKHYKNVFKIGNNRKIRHERSHLFCEL